MNATTQHTPTPELIAGKWYCIGFELFSNQDVPRMDWGQILRYDGDGCWSDDDGNAVESLWDPELQMPVSMNAADAYQVQA
jgi:hypothetical protein